MLLEGSVEIQDLSGLVKKGRPLRSYVMTEMVNGSYYLCVKNSMYPNNIRYKLDDLDETHSRFVSEGKLSLRFSQPKHLVLLQGDDKNAVLELLTEIKKIVNGEEVNLAKQQMPKGVVVKKKILDMFNPESFEFIAIERFDNRILNMRNLRRLVLENCSLPFLPEQIGDLPIEYLSLAGSDITPSKQNCGTYWDWMTADTISDTLTSLKLDRLGLDSLPFELMFLKNLQVLSLGNNNLTFIPHCIGELQKLNGLHVTNNKLRYLPENLFLKKYDSLDVSKNLFLSGHPCENPNEHDHIHKYKLLNKLNIRIDDGTHGPPMVQSLGHLSFCALVKSGMRIKRQHIPRTLWDYYNVVARCYDCKKFILPDYCDAHHTMATITATKLVMDQFPLNMAWQYVICQFKCL